MLKNLANNLHYYSATRVVSKGFSLFELILVIALISMVVGIGAPVFQNLQVQNELELAAQHLVHALRRAQAHARAVDGDSEWGVMIDTASITLFKGSSFAGRDGDFDSSTSVNGITSSGDTEIVFDKLSGFPQTTGTITLTDIHGVTRDVGIHDKGRITW